MSVGENIRRYRKLRGMTQAQLAEAVPGGFVRVSSGCLVNMAQVARIEGDGVTAADGQKIFFSRSQKKRALETLANFMGRSM